MSGPFPLSGWGLVTKDVLIDCVWRDGALPIALRKTVQFGPVVNCWLHGASDQTPKGPQFVRKRVENGEGIGTSDLPCPSVVIRVIY